ncbi:hypothetical protein SAMN05444157_2901 [Frankineae bacterium MT45]|nr:hypothetical protein SAMN05444157_2901 [Frankineae bacterium MT45]
MPKRHSQIDEVSRYCLVIGAVLLLVANLLLVAGARGVLLVLGEIFVIAGIIGMVVAWMAGNDKKQQQRSKGSSKGSKQRRTQRR